tara:strand:- start:4 stop:345 length:342 start_codon:yes stop_codon:yes gene_type:complete
MEYLTNSIRQGIKAHSLSESPDECCGLIVLNKDGLYESIKCRNAAFDKRGFFEIDPRDYLAASNTGEIKAYYHSHPRANGSFSGSDKAVSQASRLPLIMYNIKEDKFLEYTSA